jgi:hypothetical protein
MLRPRHQPLHRILTASVHPEHREQPAFEAAGAANRPGRDDLGGSKDTR